MKLQLGSFFEINTKNHGINFEFSITDWQLKFIRTKSSLSFSFGPFHGAYINYAKVDKYLQDLINNFEKQSLEDEYDMRVDNELSSTLPKNFTLN